MVGGVVTALVAGLTMAVALGWLNLSDEQIGSIETFAKAVAPIVAVIVPVIMSWFARQQVTPMADPRTEDGQPALVIPKLPGE